MKTIDELMAYLHRLDVTLWVDGDRLRYRIPRQSLTPTLRAELAERKHEIITFLRQANLATRSHLPPIQPVPRNQELPLSFAQQRLWFLAQLADKSAPYNEFIGLNIKGSLTIAVLAQSMKAIIQRHEILRTTFPEKNGTPFQAIAPSHTVFIPLIDLQSLSADKEQWHEVQRLGIKQNQQPFDLVNGPLLRTSLLRLGKVETERGTLVPNHVLLLTVHHIIGDGWSMGNFIRELSTLYEAFSQEKPSPLPPLPIQYADFAAWQRQWLSGEVLEQQVNYWKQQLAEAPALLELPTDHPRPPVQLFQGTTCSLQLSTELSAQLKALSQQTGSTLFMTLLSAFASLLARYTGSEDIVIGSPIANRTQSQIESLIGFFVNTLVLRIELSGNPTFEELLKRVKQVALDAYAHQDIPFEQLVEELQPERNLSHTPLFQVMFVLQNAPIGDFELSGLTLAPVERESVIAKFDLTLSLEETAEGLKGTLEYNTELFERATIERLSAHFKTLLTSLVTNPVKRVFELPLLSEAERHQLLFEWNNTQTDYPKEKCLHQLFEAQVEKTPDAIAVVFEDQQLTYQALNARANQLAHYLQTLGVKPEVLVGICVERSLEMIIGLLGILKAGGAYVPLDPSYPQERLAFMLEDSQVQVLLTLHKLIDFINKNKIDKRIVCLDTDWEILSKAGSNNLASNVQADNLAYVIYTSGSTGQPKGTLLTHQGLVNYLSWATQTYAVAEGQGAPVHSSVGFDATITSLYSPLLVGQKVLLLPEQQEIEELSAVLRSNSHFSLVKLTPAHLEVLSQLLPGDEMANQTNALIIGGEALTAQHISVWQTHAPETRLINEYGPTESVVGCCVYEVPATKTHSPHSHLVPIGRPIANTQLYILDQNIQPTPIGVPGELHIGGAGVARGYLNRPNLTQEKFIPNPFSDAPDARLYKTGDLARYLPDGNIEYLGRIDNQVKIRGFRIELGEIEAVLAQHNSVQENVVIVHEASKTDKRLVAFVVGNEGPVIDNTELRGFIKERLPDYMIPSAFVLLEAMPLTPNGKIDLRALSQLSVSQEPLSTETFVEPRTPVEELLAGIWANVLGIERVGIHDNFFERGGHSLLATQVMSRIRETFSVELPLRHLFESPTVASLSEHIMTQKRPPPTNHSSNDREKIVL